MAAKPRACKGCGSTTRTLTKPGPRCATCWREYEKARKAKAHDARVCKIYGLQPGEYQKLYEAQGGVCAICNKAKGLKKKLAVDHDHVTGLVRGLTCTWCNHEVLGRLDVHALIRAARYLMDPPALNVLGERYHQGE